MVFVSSMFHLLSYLHIVLPTFSGRSSKEFTQSTPPRPESFQSARQADVLHTEAEQSGKQTQSQASQVHPDTTGRSTRGGHWGYEVQTAEEVPTEQRVLDNQAIVQILGEQVGI